LLVPAHVPEGVSTMLSLSCLTDTWGGKGTLLALVPGAVPRTLSAVTLGPSHWSLSVQVFDAPHLSRELSQSR
jgi:hypothetical protein